jgi:D-alanyl-D-alanine dipeptidase
VPSALLADSATSANSVSTLKIIPVTTVAEGADPVVLATQGPLTLRAACATASEARLTVATTQANSAAAGEPGTVTPDLDPPDEVPIAQLAAPSPAYAVTSVAAFSPSGKGFTGDVALYRDGSANVCRFHGSLALQG